MKKLCIYALTLLAFIALTDSIYGQQPSARVTKAVDLMTRGDFRGGIVLLDKAIAENEGDLFPAYKLRASLKRMTGNFAGALEDYNKAIEMKADDGELYEQRAMLRLYQGQDFSLILADLDSAISHGRKFENVYSTRAMIRIRSGDKPGAISDYETAIGLRPESAGPRVGLASVHQMNGEDDKAAAVLEEFITAVESSGVRTPRAKGNVVASSSNMLPSVPGSNVQMGERSVIITDKNSGDKAPATREEMERRTAELEQSKNTAAAYSALADIYRNRKEYEKASVLVEKAFKIDRYDFTASLTRGKIRAELGDYAGAISDFDTFIRLMPNIPAIYLERGIAYFLSGKEAEAQKDFDRYLQLFPNGKGNVDKRLVEAKQKLEK